MIGLCILLFGCEDNNYSIQCERTDNLNGQSFIAEVTTVQVESINEEIALQKGLKMCRNRLSSVKAYIID